MITPEQKEHIKLQFDNFLEIIDRKEELTKENAAILEDVAGILSVKKPMVTKLFKILKKKHDEASDELEELSGLMEEVFGDD